MMALLITERALRDRRRSWVGWALGITAYVAVLTSVYPAVQSSALQRAVRDYPKELKAFFGGAASFDFSTGAGYLNVELFSLVVPALLAIAAIGYGSRSIAGERADGTLDFVLANPLTRRRVVLEKAVALGALVVSLATVVGAAVIAVGVFVDLDVGVDRIAIACLGAALVGLLVGLMAMLVGACSGGRSLSIGIPTAVFAASYLIVGLAGLVSWLEPIRVLSVLYHANGTQPLVNGLPVANYLVLTGLCAATLVATVVTFERRDLVR
jgi:ABC-2 type transport system permease protein